MRETQVQSLGRKDPLEKEMVTHSSILAWRIPWTEKPGRLQSMGSQRVGNDWAISLHYNIASISVLSVQFSCSVVSNSLQLHGLQHARLPCPSPTSGACSNSCPSSWWCHWTISSSVVSSLPQSFSASGSSQMRQFFTSGGQSIGVSASASVLPINIQDWFPLGWTVGFPCSPRDSQESSPTPQSKSINSLALIFLYDPTLTSIHDYWKKHSFD